jgi:BASS family bile acid:Na+ symporter
VIASTQLVLAMLGMGATLRPGDFAEVVRDPRGFALGIACVVAFSPLFALAVGNGFGLDPGLVTGLVLVGAVPGGTLSNILTYFARANVALSISLTGAATLGCLVTTPLILSFFAPGSERPVVVPSGRIALEISAFLLLPLLSGMALGARMGSLRERFSKLCIRASAGVIVLMVVGAASADRVNAGTYGLLVPLAMLVFSVGLMLVGLGASRAIGLPLRDAVAIGIETSFRNTSLALLIKASVFPAVAGVADPFADQVLFVVLLYAGLAFMVAMPPLLLHRRRA